MADFYKKTIRDVDLGNKKVIVRFEYNVPLGKDPDGNVVVEDDYRIVKSLPTLKYLIDQNCAIIIIASLGRPDGVVVPKLSLRPVAQELSRQIKKQVDFVDASTGDKVMLAKKKLQPGQILILENLRFHKEEESNDENFAKELSQHADYFVQDAFGNSHREHASMDAIAKFIPGLAGFLVEQEVTHLNSAITDSDRPRCAIVGGAKIVTKRALIDNLIESADLIVVGGAMANTFLVAQGHDVGASVYDKKEVDDAKKIIDKIAQTDNLELFIPLSGFATAKKVDQAAEREEKTLSEIESDDLILDFGKPAILKMLDFIAPAKTIIWNGPIGMTELDNFKLGSAAILDFMVNNKDVMTLVGGGDTAGFVIDMGKEQDLSHVSTGGGASLQLISGKKLPGVEALMDR